MYTSCSRSLPVRRTICRPKLTHLTCCSTPDYQSSSATEGVRTANMNIERFLSVSVSSKAA